MMYSIPSFRRDPAKAKPETLAPTIRQRTSFMISVNRKVSKDAEIFQNEKIACDRVDENYFGQ